MLLPQYNLTHCNGQTRKALMLNICCLMFQRWPSATTLWKHLFWHYFLIGFFLESNERNWLDLSHVFSRFPHKSNDLRKIRRMKVVSLIMLCFQRQSILGPRKQSWLCSKQFQQLAPSTEFSICTWDVTRCLHSHDWRRKRGAVEKQRGAHLFLTGDVQ